MCTTFHRDPKILETLLYFNPSVVNSRRDDGMTPLHLIAARNDLQDSANKMISLGEDAQVIIRGLMVVH